MPNYFPVRVVWLLLAAPILMVAAFAQDAARLALPTGPTLAFSALTNRYEVKPNDSNAPFSIFVTNVWTNPIVIESVNPSCHCTVASMPSEPWVLQPGQSGEIKASVELEENDVELIRMLTLFTSVGERDITLLVEIPAAPPPIDTTETADHRQAALQIAKTNPKAIFQGDCAACHVDKARGLLGSALYDASCGICHDSPNRAAFVPDLHSLTQTGGVTYWRREIAFGKTNSLMPGFAVSVGGPLSDLQIASIADWLAKNIPAKP